MDISLNILYLIIYYVHSSTGLTPNDGIKPSHELETYINMEWKTKFKRTNPKFIEKIKPLNIKFDGKIKF